MTRPALTSYAAFEAWSRHASPDVRTRSLALRAVDAMMKGQSYASALLKEAWDANEAYGRNMTDANKARRAQAARRAYNARISSEQARFMAAYAILADDESWWASMNPASTRDAVQREVVIEKKKGAELRRNIMVQAAQATTEALKNAPPLPGEWAKRSDTIQQMSVNVTGNWRPPAYIERANVFFPEDVRAAAGGLKGVQLNGSITADEAGPAWWNAYLGHVQSGVNKVGTAAQEAAMKVAAQHPGTQSMVQSAGSLLEELKQGQESMAHGSTPGDPVAVDPGISPWKLLIGAVAVYILVR